jgi:CRISPR/Cas system CSM-associated protein Csm3 (group 7 of RAMP superfamily)
MLAWLLGAFMFDARYKVSFALEVVTPLHIGAGEHTEISGVGGELGANAPSPKVARVVRDHKDRPYLPATSLKGVLRQAAEKIASPNIEVLFGHTKESAAGKGQMGAVLFRGAILSSAADAAGFPYADRARAALGPGVFVAARTAVDPRSGTAEDHKLFFQEMVAPGALFKSELILAKPGGAKQEDLDALLTVMSVFTANEGVSCGKGKSDGSGALRISPKSIAVIRQEIQANGELKSTSVSITLAKPTTASGKSWRARLVCEGPFFSADSSYEPEAAKQKLKNANPRITDPAVPQLVPQIGAAGAPLSLGSQIAGALRSRARYLHGLQMLEAAAEPLAPEQIMASIDPGGKVLRERGEAAALSPVERLFGVTGFAALLIVKKAAFAGRSRKVITSLKIDHFSGAPIDKALFATDAFLGVTLELELALAARPGAGTPTEADIALFDRLVQDIASRGLKLGHATGRGFGWFKLKETSS